MKRRTQQSRASRAAAPAKESSPAPVAVNPVRTVAGTSQPSVGNHQAAEIAPPFVPGLPNEVQQIATPSSNEDSEPQVVKLPQQSFEQVVGIPGTRTSYEDVVVTDSPLSEDDSYKYIDVKINPASQASSAEEQWQTYMSSGWRKVDNHPRESSTLVVMRMPIAQYNKMYEQSEAFYARTIGGSADVIDAPPSDQDDPGCTVRRQLASKENLNDLVDRMPKSVKELTAERNAVMEAEGLSESDLTDQDDGDE